MGLLFSLYWVFPFSVRGHVFVHCKGKEKSLESRVLIFILGDLED